MNKKLIKTINIIYFLCILIFLFACCKSELPISFRNYKTLTNEIAQTKKIEDLNSTPIASLRISGIKDNKIYGNIAIFNYVKIKEKPYCVSKYYDECIIDFTKNKGKIKLKNISYYKDNENLNIPKEYFIQTDARMQNKLKSRINRKAEKKFKDEINYPYKFEYNLINKTYTIITEKNGNYSSYNGDLSEIKRN